MYRFLAVVWKTNDPRAAAEWSTVHRSILARRADWHCAKMDEGIAVFHSAVSSNRFRAYDLGVNRGTVLGTLFRRTNDENPSHVDHALTGLTESERAAIVKSGGNTLSESYWGRYVAIIRRLDNDPCVVRDPSGSMQCFIAQCSKLSVIFNDLQDCIDLAPLRFTIDWAHVLTSLQCRRAVTQETGLQEVTQLLPGQTAVLKAGAQSRHFHWHPGTFVATTCPESFNSARRQVRQRIEQTTRAWAAHYSRILHLSSGGLDSSVVGFCLVKNPEPRSIVFLNLFTASAEGDERLFARALASKLQAKLIERPHVVPAGHLSEMLSDTPVPSSTMAGFARGLDPSVETVVAECGAEALFSGQGGDHLFQRRRTTLVAAEYLRRHSFGPRFFKVVSDTARMTREPAARVIVDAITYGLFPRQLYPYSDFRLPTLLSDEALRSAVPYNHPWVTDSTGLPHAKLFQIADLVDAYNFYAPPVAYTDVVHPLISQPIIEMCLAIPSYYSIDGGLDRSLLRAAFSADLPAEIIARTSKGATTSFFHSLFTRDIAFIREYLMGGILAQHNILDKDKVARALSEREVIYGSHMLDTVSLLLTESWLRSIDQRAHKAAA